MAMGIVNKSRQSKENAWSPAILVTLCNIALEEIGYYYYTVSSFYEYVPYITRTNINYNTLGWSRVLKQFFFSFKKNLNWYVSLDYPKTSIIRAKRIMKSSWWGVSFYEYVPCITRTSINYNAFKWNRGLYRFLCIP